MEKTSPAFQIDHLINDICVLSEQYYDAIKKNKSLAETKEILKNIRQRVSALKEAIAEDNN